MRSDNIDKMLRESERQKRKRKVVKVLLLGQSESGKSTTLKRESPHFILLLGCDSAEFEHLPPEVLKTPPGETYLSSVRCMRVAVTIYIVSEHSEQPCTAKAR